MKYRNRRQAAEYPRENGIPIGNARLAQLAVLGEGPKYRYSGRYAVYTEKDLDAWADSRLSPPVVKSKQADEIKPARRGRGRPRSKSLMATADAASAQREPARV
jgi:hypothetical protein